MNLSDAIKRKRKEESLSAKDLASKIQVRVDNLYKWEKGTKPTDPEDYLKVMNWLNGKVESIPKIEEKVLLPAQDSSQPIIQVVLNLSYIGKKNADSIDKMADSNLLNAKSIATLVNLLASSNSDLAAQLASVHESQHTADDLPAEAFLGGHGVAPKKRKVHAEKS
ncbi:MAG TPA: helix-turn-helix transcriptional regulator [Flavisolibacter sp.]|nr:helix-turn-helix transcriptional regulator [Flavisolibacter sp.]